MTSILDEETGNNTYNSHNSNTSDNSLLADWVAEQHHKLSKIQIQLKLLENISASGLDDNLDELGDRLEDIDYHCSSLANIFDLILSNYQDINLSEYNNNTDDCVHNEPNEFPNVNSTEPSKLKRWPLLQALWFHVMMATDPESIYYSSNIGKSAWLHEYIPLNL